MPPALAFEPVKKLVWQKLLVGVTTGGIIAVAFPVGSSEARQVVAGAPQMLTAGAKWTFPNVLCGWKAVISALETSDSRNLDLRVRLSDQPFGTPKRRTCSPGDL